MVQSNRFDGLPLSVTKARAKLSRAAFEHLHRDAVRLAYELWPASDGDTWQGLSVFAIDGSKYDLLASPPCARRSIPTAGLIAPARAIIRSVSSPPSGMCSAVADRPDRPTDRRRQ